MRGDFNSTSYLLIAVLLAASIIFNYSLDFNNRFIGTQRALIRVIYLALFYAAAYYIPLTINCVVTNNMCALRSLRMWMLSLLRMFSPAIVVGAPYLIESVSLLPAGERTLTFKVAKNLISILQCCASHGL